MEKVRFGVIGLGNQGRYYIKRIFGNGRIENGYVSAVCDINQSKIDALKSEEGLEGVACFNDYKEMLDSGVCDAILIETPHYLHPEIAIEALKRNIHVLCEKPAGVYAKQVQEMNEAAKKSKAVFSLMFNQRTNCLYRKMKELVDSGVIGEIQRVTWFVSTWFRCQKYYDSGSWRATWKGEGGGVLINQCPHQIDLLQWVVGKMPTKIRAVCHYGKWHDIEVEDDVTAYMEYDNGATGVFITSTGELPGTNRFEITGTKGKLLCMDGQLIYDDTKLFLYKTDEDSKEVLWNSKEIFPQIPTRISEPETDGKDPEHEGIINNFANAILGIEPLFVRGEEGIRGVELMNAIEYSGWNNGAEVSVPVNPDKYLEMLNEKIKTSKNKHVNDNVVADTKNTF